MKVHSSILHNSQRAETIPMSIMTLKNEQTAIYAQNGILLGNNEVLISTTWMNVENIMLI